MRVWSGVCGDFRFRPLQHIDRLRSEHCFGALVTLPPVRAEVNAGFSDDHECAAVDAEAGTLARILGCVDAAVKSALIRFGVARFQSRQNRPVSSLPRFPFSAPATQANPLRRLSPDNAKIAKPDFLCVSTRIPSKIPQCSRRGGTYPSGHNSSRAS